MAAGRVKTNPNTVGVRVPPSRHLLLVTWRYVEMIGCKFKTIERRPFFLTLLFLLGAMASFGHAAASGLTEAMPHVQGTRKIVLEQLDRLLMADPALQIIGQGSWLRPVGEAAKKGPISRAYADPLLGGTSDHDLRLVMKGKDQAIAQRWKLAQERLREGIRSLFPKNASPKAIENTLLKYGFKPAEAQALAREGGEAIVNKILSSVNLYAPPQLMRDVVNDKTAAAVFKKLGTVPNLGGRLIEGVWGEGTTAAIQEFEAGGRLFWNSGKGVRAGFVDLVHLAEGQGRYTLGGAANLSAQWAEKALEALHEGDPELVAKYLKRLKSTLNLAIKKGNLPTGAMGETFAHLDDLIAQAGKGTLNPGQAQRILKGARMQASVLKELARNPGATDRQILLAILDSKAPSHFGKVGEWFRHTWETADNWVLFERTLQGVFLAYSTWQVAGTWGEKGMETALRQAGVEVAMLASLPVGAVALLANHMIETAKEAGYNMAVRSQEWQDFLAGISSVKGFEGFSRKELSIDQLAVEAASPDEVRKVVESQVTHISMLRDTGVPESEVGAEKRAGIWQALVERMTPIVTAEWLRARKKVLTEYIDLALELDALMEETVFRAVIQPQPVQVEEGAGGAKATLRLESSVDPAQMRDLLRRMEDRIRPLGGKNHLVYFSYWGEVTWTCNGQKQVLRAFTQLDDLFQPVTCELPGRGSHPVEAVFRLKVDVSVGGGAREAIDVLDAKALLIREYERKVPGSVEVLTVARAKVEPVKQAKLAMPTEIMAGEPVKLTWDRSQLPAFKPGKYRVMLLPRGTQLTQQDFYLLSFDPSGNPGGVFKYPVEVIGEQVENERIEIEVQVPQVHDIQQAEQLDLAFIFMEGEASLSQQLAQASADLAKAQAEMEAFEEKLAAMPEAEREKILGQMEEAMAKAEQAPPPDMPDLTKELVAAGTVRSVPVIVRPTEIAFSFPPGWQRVDDGRVDWRQVEMQENQPQPGDYVYARGRFSVRIDYADEALNALREGLFNEAKRYGVGQQVTPLRIGRFEGEIVRWPPLQSDAPRYEARGEAFLKYGRVLVSIDYSVLTQGFMQMAYDEKGKPYVLYDTRAAAAERFPKLLESAEAMLASLRLGQQRADKTVPMPVSAPAAREAREDTYVRLVAAKTEAEPGEFVEIKAVLENPKGNEGPLTYEWGGNHAGEGDSVIFFASEPGEHDVTVIVRGTKGVVGSTSIGIRVR